MLVAVGEGTNIFATSSNGIDWTGRGSNNSEFTKGYSVIWNGTCWVAVGTGTNSSISYSYDGTTWYKVNNSNNIFRIGYGVASNPGIGPVVVDSQLVLNNSCYGLSSNLDIVSDKYYNNGIQPLLWNTHNFSK